MARTLMHELTHALDYAVNNKTLTLATMVMNGYTAEQVLHMLKVTSREPYIEDVGIAELGRSWESHVFSGYVDWNFGEVDMPSCVQEWSSFLSEYEYTRGSYSMTTRR